MWRMRKEGMKVKRSDDEEWRRGCMEWMKYTNERRVSGGIYGDFAKGF